MKQCAFKLNYSNVKPMPKKLQVKASKGTILEWAKSERSLSRYIQRVTMSGRRLTHEARYRWIVARALEKYAKGLKS